MLYVNDSWHIPRVIYQSDPQKTPIIFCQRRDDEQQILNKIGDGVLYSWIRDNDLGQQGLLVLLDRLKKYGHRSAIVVEHDEDVMVVQLNEMLAQSVPIQQSLAVSKLGFGRRRELGRLVLPALPERPLPGTKDFKMEIDFDDGPVIINIAGEYPESIECKIDRGDLEDLLYYVDRQRPQKSSPYIFIHDDFGLWAASRSNIYGRHAEGFMLLPIKDLAGFWRIGRHKLLSQSQQMRLGDIWRRERVGADRCPKVWLLGEFNVQEQRQIRDSLAERHSSDMEQSGHEFSFLEFSGSLHQLIQHFEQTLYWHGYEHHFFAFEAVDKMYAVSSSSLMHGPNDLGWHYGTLKPFEASICWVNLDIGNMSSDEWFKWMGILWLSDLKEFRKEHPNGSFS